jgi:hypothetical protein
MAPQDENVSNSEFEQMKRDLGLDDDSTRGRPSRLTERTAHTTEDDEPAAGAQRRAPSSSSSTLTPRPPVQSPVPGVIPPVGPIAPPDDALEETEPSAPADGPVTPAPDEPENQSVPKPTPPQRRPRNRRHGRKR